MQCCQQILNAINNTNTLITQKTAPIPAIQQKLTFSSTITQGQCDQQTGLYKDANTYNISTFSDGFTDLSLQVKAVHQQLCTMDTSLDAIIPDEYINFSQSGYYLVLRWGLQNDLKNPKYMGRTTLYNPIDALTVPNQSSSTQIWKQYFSNLSYVRGNQICTLFSKGNKKPVYTVFANSETEGKNLLNKIISLTQVPLDNPPRITYYSYDNNPINLANAAQTFQLIRAKVIQKATGPTDIAVVINDFHP